MALNPETEFSGKIAASDDDYPYGSAQNVTTSGDGTGTPWKARLINDLWGFFQYLLEEAEITPSGDPDTVQDSDYMDSLFAILQSTRNPFANYMHVRDEQTSGTAGQDFTASTWETRDLTTAGTNNITDASLASNQITLPAGTYRVVAVSPFHDSSTGDPSNVGHCRVYDTTGATTLATGTNAQSDYTDGENDPETAMSIAKDDFTLTVESVIELQHYAIYASSGGKAVSSGEVETYSDIEIWKLD